ncbi:MAG TPA: ATP-binding protein, partial [Candidatus Dormibacteraeota bacterium]|nr:ATP-binding protein [Candidatus Dormibacteraeota bacterium]
MIQLGRPPIESPEPVVKFAALRLLLTITSLVALIATDFPYSNGLTIVIAAVGIPWAIGNLLLAQRRPELALSPLVAVGDLAVITAVQLAEPMTYAAVRFVALFFIAAHAQFQGQRRGLILAAAGCALLVPISAFQDGPVTGELLTLYESIFVVCAFASALTAGNIRIAETAGRLRAREVSRRMIEAESDIRRRVADAIHDGPVQELVSLDMILAALSNARQRGDEQGERAMLDEAHSIVERNIQTLRDEIVALGPYAFRELSFETAIMDCVPVWRRRFGFDVDLKLEPLELSPELSGTLFQIAQEAVGNAGKHSGASHVSVTLQERAGQAELRVVDDGRGFGDFGPLVSEQPGHIGLASMRERAELLSGSLA